MWFLLQKMDTRYVQRLMFGKYIFHKNFFNTSFIWRHYWTVVFLLKCTCSTWFSICLVFLCTFIWLQITYIFQSCTFGYWTPQSFWCLFLCLWSSWGGQQCLHSVCVWGVHGQPGWGQGLAAAWLLGAGKENILGAWSHQLQLQFSSFLLWKALSHRPSYGSNGGPTSIVKF